TLRVQVVGQDAENDPVTYSATGLPPGASLDPVSGLLTWTPTMFQAGQYGNIVLGATDGNLSSTETIAIVVTPVNQPPVLVPVAETINVHVDHVDRPPSLAVTNHAVVLGQLLDFTLAGTDPDAGDKLSYSASNLPTGATLDPGTGHFSWRPMAGQEGDTIVTF